MRFRTQSDTEVVLAYARWGEPRSTGSAGCSRSLSGMRRIASCGPRSVSRENPYYAETADGLVVASRSRRCFRLRWFSRSRHLRCRRSSRIRLFPADCLDSSSDPHTSGWALYAMADGRIALIATLGTYRNRPTVSMRRRGDAADFFGRRSSARGRGRSGGAFLSGGLDRHRLWRRCGTQPAAGEDVLGGIRRRDQ